MEQEHRNEIVKDCIRLKGYDVLEPSLYHGFCLIDVAIFRPLIDQTIDFSFDLGGIKGLKPGQTKMNHRFPNQDYHTLSQKDGTRVSRFGCYITLSIPDMKTIHFFNIEVKDGVKGKTIHRFPVEFRLSEEYPCAMFGCTYDPNSGHFAIETVRRCGGDGKEIEFQTRCYSTHKETVEKEYEDCGQLLTVKSARDNTVEYNEVIVLDGVLEDHLRPIPVMPAVVRQERK